MDVIKDLEIKEDYPELSEWVQCTHKGPYKREAEVRKRRECCAAGLEYEGRSHKPENTGSL